MATVDASNSCIPPSSPLVASCPPLPTTVRGQVCVIDGRPGRLNKDRSILLYSSGRLVVVRELDYDANDDGDDDQKKNKLESFVYRGHMANVTAAKFSPSGAYVASADARGKLRVWSFDNEEHLCKLDLNVMTGPIRDIAWDVDSKRICFVGERSDTSSDCARVIQWDTGVTCGVLAQHTRGRASTCDFKPNRPMRIATGGQDDSRVYLNAGPPFARVVDGTPTEDVHTKGAVNCLRFNSDGSKIISVGADKTLALYDGKTMALIEKMENVHAGTIYTCAWNSSNSHILTCSADGCAKLLSVEPLQVVHTWNVAELLHGSSLESVPVGGMLVGCAFVKDDIPVTISISGEISLLPKPSSGLETGLEEHKKLTGHVAPIVGMAMDGGKSHIYTADSDGLLCMYSLSTNQAVQRFSAPSSTDMLGKMHGDATISCVTVAKETVLTAGWDDTIRMVDVDGTTLEETIALEAQPNAMSTGTELTVVITVRGLVLVRDRKAVSSLIELSFSALSVCVSKDDSTIYIGGEDCKIRVFSVVDSSTVEEKHCIEQAHLKPVHALSLSNDESKLASGDVRDLCVWDLSNNYATIIGKSRWCFHTQRITCLTWSPDDSILASGGADDSIYLWSLTKKMKRLHYAFSHRGGVTGLAFLKDGLKLVSVGADSCVNQWDVMEDATKKFA